MDCEQQHHQMEVQQQIMIMMDGLYQNQDQDLLDLLGSEPQCTKKASLNYDYLPATSSLLLPNEEEMEEGGLKTSNRSTSTCADSEITVRKCTCAKTRCIKNYCQCFKLGQTCGIHCECKDCGNKQKLFLSKAVIKIKCKCMKSHCLKKYCQCHSSGQKCGPECKCLECQNIDVSEQMEMQNGGYFDHHLFFDI